MIKLQKKSKIYVMCPACLKTGGPESLHNLVHHLRKYGHNAKILYVPSIPDAMPEEDKSYNIGRVDSIEDTADNLLIVPEIWIQKLNPYHKIQKAIWWLSVDYYFLENQTFDFDFEDNKKVAHFAQSKYVENFLIKSGAKYIYGLNSFINKDYFRKLKRHKREDQVLYNPKKGLELIKVLVDKYPSINWVPITNMKRSDVIRLMRRSKVYIDFGPFPGKERMPREAAINGCCIICGIRGAASFYQDLAIPNEYKFRTEPFEADKIYAKIQECLDNYDKRLKDFEYFRRLTIGEKERFEFEIKNIFGNKRTSLKTMKFVMKNFIISHFDSLAGYLKLYA